MQKYLTIENKVRAVFTVEGSRFIATMAPASLEAEAYRLIDALREEFTGATHNTYAFRVGGASSPVERCSDDREPAGTAGPPMLQLLRGEGVFNVVVVGTRFFGGTKLGIGGLTRAYRECARAALQQATIIEKEQTCSCNISVSYGEQGSLARHIQSMGGEIITIDYSDQVTVTAVIPRRHAETLREAVADLSRGRGRIEWA